MEFVKRLFAGILMTGSICSMIIDAHVHLPAGEPFRSLRAKKEKLLQAMECNHVDKCIVIADSWPESEIGSIKTLR